MRGEMTPRRFARATNMCRNVGTSAATSRAIVWKSKPRNRSGTIKTRDPVRSKHEYQLTMAQDRHDRMSNCADPNACQHDRQEFPSIWKLERDDIALANAQDIQPKRDTVSCRRKLGIGEPGDHPALTGPRSDRRRFRVRGGVAVEEVGKGLSINNRFGGRILRTGDSGAEFAVY